MEFAALCGYLDFVKILNYLGRECGCFNNIPTTPNPTPPKSSVLSAPVNPPNTVNTCLELSVLCVDSDECCGKPQCREGTCTVVQATSKDIPRLSGSRDGNGTLAPERGSDTPKPQLFVTTRSFGDEINVESNRRLRSHGRAHAGEALIVGEWRGVRRAVEEVENTPEVPTPAEF
jgi:hypothetical protein